MERIETVGSPTKKAGRGAVLCFSTAASLREKAGEKRATGDDYAVLKSLVKRMIAGLDAREFSAHARRFFELKCKSHGLRFEDCFNIEARTFVGLCADRNLHFLLYLRAEVEKEIHASRQAQEEARRKMPVVPLLRQRMARGRDGVGAQLSAA